MQRPDPVFIYRSGIKNVLDFAILWHLAMVGLTGSNLPDLMAALDAPDPTLRRALERLESMKLVVASPNRDLPGHPLTWVCSRMGNRIVTGHLNAGSDAPGAVEKP